LVEYGLSLEDEDVYGQTPIYYAAKENRLSMIPEMIRLGGT
jgi:ankyrin repeat protein